MGNHALMRARGGIRPLDGAPEPAIARELRFPKSRSRLQLRRLPERALGGAPSAVGWRHGGQSIRQPITPTATALRSRTTPSRKPCTDPARRHPASSRRRWRDGSRRRGRGRRRRVAASPPGRAALAPDRTARGKISCISSSTASGCASADESSRKPNNALPLAPDHLQGALFSRQKRDAQGLLPVSDPLDGHLGFLKSDPALHFDEAADVVRRIRHRHGRRLPQLPLGKGERVEAGFPAFQPLLEKRAFVSGHGVGSAG